MRDSISLERANKLHPLVRQEVIDIITEIEEKKFPANMKIRIVQGLRTIAEQDALYAQGRTTPGKIVTKAKGGKSYHNYGTAIDFAIMYDKDGDGHFEELSWSIVKDGDNDGKKDWDEVIEAFEAKGWESGAKWRTFKDYPHLEKRFNHSVSQLFAKHTAGKFIDGTQYVNLS